MDTGRLADTNPRSMSALAIVRSSRIGNRASVQSLHRTRVSAWEGMLLISAVTIITAAAVGLRYGRGSRPEPLEPLPAGNAGFTCSFAWHQHSWGDSGTADCGFRAAVSRTTLGRNQITHHQLGSGDPDQLARTNRCDALFACFQSQPF
jgi:hypothetical protein